MPMPPVSLNLTSSERDTACLRPPPWRSRFTHGRLVNLLSHLDMGEGHNAACRVPWCAFSCSGLHVSETSPLVLIIVKRRAFPRVLTNSL
jgi:hypothetical protein